MLTSYSISDTPASLDSVHNYYEQMVISEINRQLGNRAADTDFIADVARSGSTATEVLKVSALTMPLSRNCQRSARKPPVPLGVEVAPALSVSIVKSPLITRLSLEAGRAAVP